MDIRGTSMMNVPRLFHRLMLVFLFLPAFAQFSWGLALISDANVTTGSTGWLAAAGIPPLMIAWTMLIGSGLFVVYNIWLRTRKTPDIVISGIFNSPALIRLVVGWLYVRLVSPEPIYYTLTSYTIAYTFAVLMYFSAYLYFRWRDEGFA